MKFPALLLFLLLFCISSFAISPIVGSPHQCVGTTRHMTCATPGGSWTCSNTSIATIDGSTGDITGISPGSATIIYTVGLSYVTTIITVHALPGVYSLTGGGPYCAADSGSHVGLSSSDGGIDYTLYAGSFGTTPVPGIGVPLDFGFQTIAASYTAVAFNPTTTCSSDMLGSVAVSVIPSVTPAAHLTVPTGDSICAGATSVFTVSPVNAGTTPHFEWTVNGTIVAADVTTYSFIPANGDMIVVKMLSSELCAFPDSVYDTFTMTVFPHATPYVNLNTTPGDTVCYRYTATHAAIGAYTGDAPIYMWMRNGIYSAAGPVFSYRPNDGDSVYCVMISNYFCRTNDTAISPTEYMVVDTPGIPYVIIDAYPNSTVKYGETATIVATVPNADHLSFQWWRNGTMIPGAISDTYVANDFDTAHYDSVACVVVSDHFCRLVGSSWILISVSYLSVGNHEAEGSKLAIMPNPNNGSFTLKGKMAEAADGPVTIDITNMLGQQMYSKEVIAPGGAIAEQINPGNQLSSGWYILTLHSEKGNMSYRFQVQ